MFTEALADLFARAAARRAERDRRGTPTRSSRPRRRTIDLRERRTTGKLAARPVRLSGSVSLNDDQAPSPISGSRSRPCRRCATSATSRRARSRKQAIPPLLQGRDVIGQAQTGTGKTAAFGLPIMEYVDPSEQTVQALVLTPTRELCIQVTQALRTTARTPGSTWSPSSAARRSAPSRPSCGPAATSSWARSAACWT